jgi:hypothetical protein
VAPNVSFGQPLSAGFGACPPEAVAGQIEAMGVVDETVEDRIGVGRVPDDRVPILHGELAGDDGRSAAVSFFKDLQEIVAGLGIERFQCSSPQSSRISSWTPPSARVMRA